VLPTQTGAVATVRLQDAIILIYLTGNKKSSPERRMLWRQKIASSKADAVTTKKS
jgi:hypothetical protein